MFIVIHEVVIILELYDISICLFLCRTWDFGVSRYHSFVCISRWVSWIVTVWWIKWLLLSDWYDFFSLICLFNQCWWCLFVCFIVMLMLHDYCLPIFFLYFSFFITMKMDVKPRHSLFLRDNCALNWLQIVKKIVFLN